MNAAVATPTAPPGPATGAAPEPITAAQRAREQVEQAFDTAHPTPTDARAEAILDALPPAGDVDHADLPMAVVVMVITRDRITQHAHLHLGGLHSAHRNFVRGERGFWNSRDPEFILAEDRIGVELAEFVDRLDFPGRVAEMLPRLPADSGSQAMASAAATVEEIRHG